MPMPKCDLAEKYDCMVTECNNKLQEQLQAMMQDYRNNLEFIRTSYNEYQKNFSTARDNMFQHFADGNYLLATQTSIYEKTLSYYRCLNLHKSNKSELFFSKSSHVEKHARKFPNAQNTHQ